MAVAPSHVTAEDSLNAALSLRGCSFSVLLSSSSDELGLRPISPDIDDEIVCPDMTDAALCSPMNPSGAVSNEVLDLCDSSLGVRCIARGSHDEELCESR